MVKTLSHLIKMLFHNHKRQTIAYTAKYKTLTTKSIGVIYLFSIEKSLSVCGVNKGVADPAEN